MNLPPAGTMSGVDTGACEGRLTRSSKARSTPNLFGWAEVVAQKRAIRLANGLVLGVNDGWRASGENEVTGAAETHVRRGLASKHTLKERRGFGKPARVREARRFEHHIWI